MKRPDSDILTSDDSGSGVLLWTKSEASIYHKGPPDEPGEKEGDALEEEDEADPLVEDVVLLPVPAGVMGPDAGMDHAWVIIEPHVLSLLRSWLSSLWK